MAGTEGEAQGEGRERVRVESEHGGDAGGVDLANGGRCGIVGVEKHGDLEGAQRPLIDRPSARRPWDGAKWINCGDGKARRIEPGLEPLVNGLPGRVGLLRGLGNSIVPQVAAEFIRAYGSAS